jgi:SAM-dependent methyltransferase
MASIAPATAAPAPIEPLAAPLASKPMLTHVEIRWHEGAQEDWFKFGKPAASRIIDRHTRAESYAPGHVFALVRWAANDHGTIRSSLDIVRAVARGEAYTTLAQVDPGGEILLAVSGWPKVAQVFRQIDAIEASGIDPCDVAPDHWRHVHNRLAIAAKPRAYTPERHRAWLARQRVLP